MSDPTLHPDAEPDRPAERFSAAALLALRAGHFGPSPRDQAIGHAICVLGEHEERVAWDFRLSPRTVRNIARRTRQRIARREFIWSRMTLHELLVEEDRLREIYRRATEEWRASQQPQVAERTVISRRGTKTTPTRRKPKGQPRFVALATWAAGELCAIELRVEARLAEHPGARGDPLESRL